MVAILAMVVAGVSMAAATTWASKADKVCVFWKATAKAALGSTAPKTPSQAYELAVKATALEQAELSALEKIPSPTPAGKRALAAVKIDIAEIRVGIRDWRAGDKAGFIHVFNVWQHDFRPHKAFLAAGASACG